MKVLAWLYVVSIISGVIKVSNSYKNDGIESLALIVPCVICFWRAKRPESNKWLEFFGLLFTIATSGGIMSYITASYRSERETAVYLTLVFAGLTTLFYVLCERKISGKLISPKLSIIERSQSNVQQPVYQQPLNIQQPVLTTVTSPQSSTETKSQRPKLIGKEYKHESYYDRLKRLCTPSNFVDNYDKEKVDIANGIYAKILNTNRDDSDAKHALLVETEAKLGLNLLDESDYETLKNNLNPKNFINPYDAEKIALANELYSEILQPDINYTKYEEITKRAEPLLIYLANLKKKQDELSRFKQEEWRKQQKVILIIGIVFWLLIFLFMFMTASCNEKQPHQRGVSTNSRQPNCHLDKLNIKGNVVKIETITNSTIPLTEMTYDIFGSNGINTMDGNIVLDFDNNGFIKRYTGYGIDGKQVFSNSYYNKADDLFPATIGGYGNIVRMETVKNDNGRVSEAIYYGQDQKPIYTMKMYFDSNNNVSKITKEQSSYLKDSTEYKYLEFDNMGNWTVAEVSYKDVIKTHHHKYIVKRQITYDGEPSKTPLVNQLSASTNTTTEQKPRLQSIKGSFFNISIPDYMVIKNLSNNRRSYNYKDGGDIAYFALNLLPGNHIFAGATSSDFVYDAQADEMLRQRYSNQGDMVRIFKWFPYEFTNINGFTAMHIKYYRYGNLNPIPQLVEQYIFDSPQGEVDITFSYQSDREQQFKTAFHNAVKTLQLF